MAKAKSISRATLVNIIADLSLLYMVHPATTPETSGVLGGCLGLVTEKYELPEIEEFVSNRLREQVTKIREDNHRNPRDTLNHILAGTL